MYLSLLIYLATNIFITNTKIVIDNTNYKTINRIDVSSCTNIKLPLVEDRVCIKINFKHYKSSRPIYVLAINKHEMEYSKCYPGMQAALVPMYKCNDKIIHHKLQRIKRRVDSDSYFYVDDRNKNGGEENDYQNYEDYASTVREIEDRKINEWDESMVSEELQHESRPYGQAFGQVIPIAGHKADAKRNLTLFWKGEQSLKHLPHDYDQNMSDAVDFNQYKKKCPTVCPNRHVMVCAKCQHQVYRSFLSVCHLKAFSCKHPDEKLELVRRGPCVQSAPFFTGLPKVQGKLIEPNDEDVVLKFINCRQNGKLDTDDPRCKFENKNIEVAPE